jgi:hypothetical protein
VCDPVKRLLEVVQQSAYLESLTKPLPENSDDSELELDRYSSTLLPRRWCRLAMSSQG